jgi:[acyl-carrier-protein] S-malonyltransferase
MKIAVLFSGQGSQYVGMGLDFINSSQILKDKVSNYSKVTNLNIIDLLSDESKINVTRYTQPLMAAVEIIIYDYLKQNLNLKIEGFTGFSLGLFPALYAAGYIDDVSLMGLVNNRAIFMEESSIDNPGKMAAILNLDDKIIEDLCIKISTEDQLCTPANYNSPGQLVISGHELKVKEAVEKLLALGAKRAIMLNVSGAFHSPLMYDASLKLKDYIKDLEFKNSRRLVYRNSNAQPLTFETIKEEIEIQVYKPVFFKQSITNMINDGFTHFIEIGPGNVLSNLVRKIDPNVTVVSLSKISDMEKLKEIFI